MEMMLSKLIDHYKETFELWEAVNEVFGGDGKLGEVLDNSRELIYELVDLPEDVVPTEEEMITGDFFARDYWSELLYDYAKGENDIHKGFLMYELMNWNEKTSTSNPEEKITLNVSGVKCEKCGEGIESSLRVEDNFTHAQILCPYCNEPFVNMVHKS